MNNVRCELEILFDVAFSLFRKSLILLEYDKLNETSKLTFRRLFLTENSDIENTIDSIPSKKLEDMVGWLESEAYYNSDEYIDNRYDP